MEQTILNPALCLSCGSPATHGFRHCAACLDAMIFDAVEGRGGLSLVSFHHLEEKEAKS